MTKTLAQKVKKQPGVKLRGADKTDRIPVKIIPTEVMPKKPDWIRVRIPASPKVSEIKRKLRTHGLHSVCEEASCPNLGECFSHGTATFMIMGDICTRRCPFCDVAHGRPLPLNEDEPVELAKAIADMALKYVVITSVDRDDLRDGGAAHIARCVLEVRRHSPDILVETLVPDFRGRLERAVAIMQTSPPDVFNHNLETVPSLYKKVRPGSDYRHSLELLRSFKQANEKVRTKSGLMVGCGERLQEIKDVMVDLHEHRVDMVTIGQYLQPSKHHLAVDRFVHPDEFKELEDFGYQLGFQNVASGPLVRSSYHADLQAKGDSVG